MSIMPDKREVKALRSSIKHWVRLSECSKNVLGTEGPREKDCALCAEYINEDCNKCPVKMISGKPFCEDTPFWAAYNEFRCGTDSMFCEAAKVELNFLKAVAMARGVPALTVKRWVSDEMRRITKNEVET